MSVRVQVYHINIPQCNRYARFFKKSGEIFCFLPCKKGDMILYNRLVIHDKPFLMRF